MHLPGSISEKVHVFDSVDSTNDVLKDMARKGAPSGTVVISDCQTGGKGRRGRSFASPKGVGIYFSYLFKPESGFDKISNLTSWTAIAVSDAIYNAYGIDSQVKWVNDLLMNRKKICGILTEVTVEAESGLIDNCIIGIGIPLRSPSRTEERHSTVQSLPPSSSKPWAILYADGLTMNTI